METAKSVLSLKKSVHSKDNGYCQSLHLSNRGQKGWSVPEEPTNEDTISNFLPVNPHLKARAINSLCAHVIGEGEGVTPEAWLFWVRNLSNLSQILQLPCVSVVNKVREVKNREEDGKEANVRGEEEEDKKKGRWGSKGRMDVATQCLQMRRNQRSDKKK